MNIPDLLDEVADEVSLPDGWTQQRLGNWQYEAGPVCAMGGIYRVMTRHGISLASAEIPQSSIYAPVGDYVLTHPREYGTFRESLVRISPAVVLVGYNNTLGRTAGEVADLFRTVAKHLREET